MGSWSHSKPEGWFMNVSMDEKENFVALDIGYVTFKPKEIRFLTSREQAAAGLPLERALENERMIGPAPTAESFGDFEKGAPTKLPPVPTLEQLLAQGMPRSSALGDIAMAEALHAGKTHDEACAAGQAAYDAAKLEEYAAEKAADEKAEADEKVAADARAADEAAKLAAEATPAAPVVTDAEYKASTTPEERLEAGLAMGLSESEAQGEMESAPVTASAPVEDAPPAPAPTPAAIEAAAPVAPEDMPAPPAPNMFEEDDEDAPAVAPPVPEVKPAVEAKSAKKQSQPASKKKS